MSNGVNTQKRRIYMKINPALEGELQYFFGKSFVHRRADLFSSDMPYLLFISWLLLETSFFQIKILSDVIPCR